MSTTPQDIFRRAGDTVTFDYYYEVWTISAILFPDHTLVIKEARICNFPNPKSILFHLYLASLLFTETCANAQVQKDVCQAWKPSTLMFVL